jgi:L-alanine-DL-glutamate epimerase-like enolase superfamily enzyme
MLESTVSAAAAAHLAASQKVITRIDLDAPLLCAENPYTGGPAFNCGEIIMSGDAGIGVTPL